MFNPDDREAITAAVRRGDANDPIMYAINERVFELLETFEQYCKAIGYEPTHYRLDLPMTVLDEVACRLFLEGVNAGREASLKIIWVDQTISTSG